MNSYDTECAAFGTCRTSVCSFFGLDLQSRLHPISISNIFHPSFLMTGKVNCLSSNVSMCKESVLRGWRDSLVGLLLVKRPDFAFCKFYVLM